VKDPKGFRRMLGECEAIVSDDVALQFFERTERESDIEVYMEEKYIRRFTKYLIECEKYVSVGDTEEDVEAEIGSYTHWFGMVSVNDIYIELVSSNLTRYERLQDTKMIRPVYL
jgi:hypothetical protein